MKTHKRRVKHRKSNKARGPVTRSQAAKLQPLSPTYLTRSASFRRTESPRSSRPSSSPSSSSRRLVPLRSSSRNNGRRAASVRRRPKKVQINTSENEIMEYTLGSSEREWKQATPIKGVPKCKSRPSVYDFPCKKKRTVFNNLRDYEGYLVSKESRNESTGYKSKSQHYDDIEAMLMWQGSDLRRK